MSKLPTTPSVSAKKPSIPSTEAKLPRGDKELKGPAQRYYGRTIRLASQAAKLMAEVKVLAEREQDGGKSKGAVGAAFMMVGAAHDQLNKMLGQWTALSDIGWSPAKVSRGPVAGQVVGLKDFAVERFTKHGAYTKSDVEKLKVISVHGNQSKVATLKGENLGIINNGWLTKE
jgi:hypothetical protein